MARERIPEKFQLWIDARKRHDLSHAQVQMARELGMNSTRPGKIDNADQEPWKVPLPKFIEELKEARRRAGLVTRSDPQPSFVEEP